MFGSAVHSAPAGKHIYECGDAERVISTNEAFRLPADRIAVPKPQTNAIGVTDTAVNGCMVLQVIELSNTQEHTKQSEAAAKAAEMQALAAGPATSPFFPPVAKMPRLQTLTLPSGVGTSHPLRAHFGHCALHIPYQSIMSNDRPLSPRTASVRRRSR